MNATFLAKKIIVEIKSIPKERLDDVISELISLNKIGTEGRIREFYKAIYSIYESENVYEV